jgi:hypothetical protein
MSAEIRTRPNLASGTPKLLFKPAGSDLGRFAASADGQRFLLNEPVEKGDLADITVVLNWTAGVR